MFCLQGDETPVTSFTSTSWVLGLSRIPLSLLKSIPSRLFLSRFTFYSVFTLENLYKMGLAALQTLHCLLAQLMARPPPFLIWLHRRFLDSFLHCLSSGSVFCSIRDNVCPNCYKVCRKRGREVSRWAACCSSILNSLARSWIMSQAPTGSRAAAAKYVNTFEHVMQQQQRYGKACYALGNRLRLAGEWVGG